MAKIDIWDLETSTSGFKANSGFILCATIKRLDIAGGNIKRHKVEVLRRDNMMPNPLNDKKLVKQISKRLMESDVWVTHNGRWFDIPFLNSRLLHWGLPPLPSMPHFDTCETSFKKLKIRNSLEAVGEFLGCKMQKYKVSMDHWIRAYAGNEQSLLKIIKHGIKDAQLTEQVYLRMRPLGYKHPNVALINEDERQCPVCGKKNTLQSRGWLPAKVNRAKRYQCVPSKGGCGTWSHAKYEKVKGIDVRI